MAKPILLYGSNSWTITSDMRSKIDSAEIAFLRRVKGCTRLDRIKSKDVGRKLEMVRVLDETTITNARHMYIVYQ